MADKAKVALLVLDCQTGLADAAFATSAIAQVVRALEAAREHKLNVFFSMVGFRPGAPEVADSNPVFLEAKQKVLFELGTSKVLPRLTPLLNEPIVVKSRFGAFAGTDLGRMIHAQGITELVLTGVSTSGVVLSAFCTQADEDFSLKVLSDACADPKQTLHDELMADLFPRSAEVLNTDDWIASLATLEQA